MILLKTLQLNNFLSHESTKINFEENQKILFDGKSGSGKSSIVEALLFCFYGKGRSDNKSLVRKNSKGGASISLTITDGNLQTIITRSISDSGKNTLTVTQNSGTEGQFLPIKTTGLKDTQNWIEKELLKASYELFTNSIAYPQESETSFVRSNASKRKDLLLEIVRAGNFDELYDKTKEFLSNTEVENAVHLSNILHLEDSIKASVEVSRKLGDYTQKYEFSSIQLEQLNKNEKELEKELHTISNVTSQITNSRRMVKVLNDAVISIDAQLDFNNKQIEEHNKIDLNELNKNIEESEKLSKELEITEEELKNGVSVQEKINNHLSNKPICYDYSLDIEAINKRLIPLIKETKKCPAGDTCPYVVPIKGQIDFLTEQITEKTEKIALETKTLEKWQNVYNLLEPPKDTTEIYSKLKDIQFRIQFLSKFKDLATKYLLFKDGLGELMVKLLTLANTKEDNLKDISELEITIKSFEEQLSKFDINKVNLDLANIRISKQEVQKIRDESSVGKQLAINAEATIRIDSAKLESQKSLVLKSLESISEVNLLKEALSPRGIKAVVIDYLIPQLEERINNVLGQMSDFKIRLDTQTTKADEEGTKEGLFITVINDRMEELSFDNYSGGEKVKITIAISEALASLMNQIGFRIMDENIVSLDRESTEGFVEVLTKLQDKFPQLIVISHLQEVKDMFEKKIEIIKVNGISKTNEIN